MEYYCMMVLTGEEKKVRDRARQIFKDTYPTAQFYFFERDLYTKRRGWFRGALFTGYLFFCVEELTADFFCTLRSIKGFCRILRENQNPTELKGPALEELQFLISHGEVLGVSKVVFLPGQKVKAISGPLVGYEGQIVQVNKKNKQITVRSFLTEDCKKFDLKFEQVELLSDVH